MARVLTVSLAIVLASGVATLGVPAAQAQKPAAVPRSTYYDVAAERRLLDLANRDRMKAGLAPLQKDEGLTRAAREHATAMAAQQKLSHQLAGEPSLVHRLAANSKTHLDQTGENVAFAGSVDQAQDNLMHSPPHRANLLNAGYNVAGFSVVRRGSLLYVTQDFGHSLPSRSDAEAEVLVARSVDRVRAQSRLPGLERMERKEAASMACAMAEADSLRTPGPRARAVLRYTTSEPGLVPESAAGVIKERSLAAFAAGSCYARTPTYPTGVYWVALLFY
ncbi:MAG TPA: CAP domain-containing protein [Terriglobales bacterium]|jgi:uncharacterized protein YkwD|nr:CAP domain-containing protein [Terriglobales bacterium]